MTISLVARETTWLHQRRKRREAKRAEEKKVTTQEVGKTTHPAAQENDAAKNSGCEEPDAKKRKIDIPEENKDTKGAPMEIETKTDKDIPGTDSKETKADKDISGTDSKGTTDDAKPSTAQNIKNGSQHETHGSDTQALNSNHASQPSGDSASGKGCADVTESDGKASTSNLDISIEDVEDYILKASLTLRKLAEVIQLEMLWVDGENKQSLFQLMQFFKNKFH